MSEKIKVVKTFSFLNGILDGFNVIYCKVSKINAMNTFESHPSNLKIKELNSCCKFSFQCKFERGQKNYSGGGYPNQYCQTKY